MTKGAASKLSFLEPMMALRLRDLPVGDWLYELKFDGYRALAFKAGKEVRLISRNRAIFNDDYPQLIDALRLLTAGNVIIDGEIAALDSEGKSSFQLPQSYGTRYETRFQGVTLRIIEHKFLRVIWHNRSSSKTPDLHHCQPCQAR